MGEAGALAVFFVGCWSCWRRGQGWATTRSRRPAFPPPGAVSAAPGAGPAPGLPSLGSSGSWAPPKHCDLGPWLGPFSFPLPMRLPDLFLFWTDFKVKIHPHPHLQFRCRSSVFPGRRFRDEVVSESSGGTHQGRGSQAGRNPRVGQDPNRNGRAPGNPRNSSDSCSESQTAENQFFRTELICHLQGRTANVYLGDLALRPSQWLGSVFSKFLLRKLS